MPDRTDLKPGQTIVQHTLEKAWEAIYRACYSEDGLEATDGEYVLELIVDALGYDPTPENCACGKKMKKCEGH